MIALVIKATVILGVALLATSLAARARASVRHGILLAAFAMLIALPLATLSLPRIAVPILPLAEPLSDSSVTASVARPAEEATSLPSSLGQPQTPAALRPAALRVGVTEFVLLVWMAGAAMVLLSLALGIYRLQQLRRTAIPAIETRRLMTALAAAAGVRSPVDVMAHERLRAPIACGVLRPSIVLPADTHGWTEAEISRALVHELEHVKRRDWISQVVARGVCAIYWFHPLAWMAYRRLCLEAELACDDAAIAGEENTMYAEQLVSLARRMASTPAVAVLGMAHRSDLATRVTAVLDERKVRGRAGLTRVAAIAAIALATTLSLAPLDLVAAPGAGPAGAPEAPDEPGAPARDGGANATEQSPRFDRMLVEAADEGDLNDVRRLLDGGGNVNAVALGDGSPLIAAARNGHLELVRFLIDRGADVNLAVRGDGAPLIMAAREGHLAIVQLLLDRGADANLEVPDDENALIQASGGGHLAVVRLLVDRGANVNARVWADGYGRRDGEWRTPLSLAIRGGHRAVADFLRSRGAID